MKSTRRLSRRSFFSRVAGGVAFGALASVSGHAESLQRSPQGGITDSDPFDPAGGGVAGFSDQDNGPNSDPTGQGRHSGPATARRAPDGRCLTRSGLTDGDFGAHRDPAGYGTRRGSGANVIDSSKCP